MKQTIITRRQFIRTSAMTAALTGIVRPFNILRAQTGSLNDKLNIAAIGVAGIAKGVPGQVGKAPGLGRATSAAGLRPVQPSILPLHGETNRS